MQTFYNRLFARPDARNTHKHYLIRLSKATLDQVAALKSSLGWGTWPGSPASSKVGDVI